MINQAERLSDLQSHLSKGEVRLGEPEQAKAADGAGTGTHLADLAGLIRIAYPNAAGIDAVREIAEALRQEFAQNADLEDLNHSKRAHYLSPLVLVTQCGVDRAIADELARAFITMEAFATASVDEVLQRVPAWRRGAARGVQEDIAELLRKRGPTP